MRVLPCNDEHGFLETEVALKAKARVAANLAVSARKLRRHDGQKELGS